MESDVYWSLVFDCALSLSSVCLCACKGPREQQHIRKVKGFYFYKHVLIKLHLRRIDIKDAADFSLSFERSWLRCLLILPCSTWQRAVTSETKEDNQTNPPKQLHIHIINPVVAFSRTKGTLMWRIPALRCEIRTNQDTRTHWWQHLDRFLALEGAGNVNQNGPLGVIPNKSKDPQ